MTNSHYIVSGGHLIESMRYGGYRNPAYALAELIDNSVEADAKHIEVMCMDDVHYNEKKQTLRLREIAILDDGHGMTKDILWNSLIFGEGTRRSAKGIGRFGMGLPNSSISQCKRVTVYSWQKPDEVFSTYIDLDELAKTDQRVVPEPKKASIPDYWKKHAKKISDSGTLVVWSKLDKCTWRKSDTLIKNSEKLIGRIYRKYITKHKLTIRMIAFTDSEVRQVKKNILPNDPLYLTDISSTPEPWHNEAMFSKYGDSWEQTFPMKTNNNSYDVILRFAIAKNKAREGDLAGARPHGKHASGNLGISIIRADRELNLDTNLLRTYDPTERWWGVEVEFPTALDEMFGITNNKQDATNFSSMTKRVGAQEDGAESTDYDDIDSESLYMYNLVTKINSVINNMRKDLKASKTDTRKLKKVQEEFNEMVKKRYGSGQIKAETETKRTTSTPQEREDELVKAGVPKEKARTLVEEDIRARFEEREISGKQFFDVGTEGGILSVTVNTNHNAYTNFVALLEDIPETKDPEKLLSLLKQVRFGFKLVLGSWACYENETPNRDKRKEIADSRYEWGQRLEDFLRRHE